MIQDQQRPNQNSHWFQDVWTRFQKTIKVDICFLVSFKYENSIFQCFRKKKCKRRMSFSRICSCIYHMNTLVLWNAHKSMSSHSIMRGAVFHTKTEKLLKGLWDAIRKASKMIYPWPHALCLENLRCVHGGGREYLGYIWR